MDYTPGARHIAKWQWDLMHDPGIVMRVFERDQDAAGLLKHNMSGIRYNDSLVANNQTLYFLPQLKEKVKFLAKKDKKDNAEEQLKVEWRVKDRKEKSDSLVFTADADFFGNELQIKITAKDDFLLGLGKDSLININIEKIEIDIEKEIISVLSELLDTETAFNHLVDSINTEIAKSKFDDFLIKGKNEIYIKKGMNKLIDASVDNAANDNRLFDLMQRLYNIDLIIAKYEGKFDQMIDKINNVMTKNENGEYSITDPAFTNSVIERLKEKTYPFDANAKQLYKSDINTIVIKIISGDE
jgi:hypothetical protein